MEKNVKKLQTVHLKPSSPLQLFVWRLRRGLRNIFGWDILDTQQQARPGRTKVRKIYRQFDEFMVSYLPNLQKRTPHKVALQRVRDVLVRDLDYRFSDIDEQKPWGAYYRIADNQTSRFLAEFFPDLSEVEAKLGRNDVQLSPKILVVYPGHRLSWQYHNRRAERWRFLTAGIYYRGHSDVMGKQVRAKQGDIVQFATGERHRLGSYAGDYTLVAEIWQHTEEQHPSDEADIIRLADDYKR